MTFVEKESVVYIKDPLLLNMLQSMQQRPNRSRMSGYCLFIEFACAQNYALPKDQQVDLNSVARTEISFVPGEENGERNSAIRAIQFKQMQFAGNKWKALSQEERNEFMRYAKVLFDGGTFVGDE